MSHLSRTPRTNGSRDPQNHRDPQLGGDRAIQTPKPDLTGYEPLLGGLRRIGPDMRRIKALLDAPNAEVRTTLIDKILDMGQARLYADELILVVPARARARSENWRGTFTPTQRIAAMHALGSIGGPEAVGVLVATLADSIYEVRHTAETALIAICRRLEPDDPVTATVITTLVRALGLLPMSARKVVARILAERPPDLVLPALLRDGLTATDWQARRESAWVLGALGDIRATKRLIDALQSDSSGAVRSTAAWALGQLDAPVAIEPLLKTAEEDDEIVRAAALEALGEHARRLDPIDDEDFRPALAALVKGLHDEDWSVRHTAIDALTELDQPEARAALQKMLKR